MLKAVYEFNKIRNDFKYDEKLERQMYLEEVREFFDAKTTAERLDALVDCEYVRFGTMFKLVRNDKSYTDLPYDKDGEQLMVSMLTEEIGDELFPLVHNKARDIVCGANALKGSNLGSDGKVLKTQDTPNATEQIAQMLQDEYDKRDAILEAHAKKQQEAFDELNNGV